MFKNKSLLVFLILLFIGFSIYVNSFSNQFFWDDNDTIVNNSYVKDYRNIPKFFSQNLIAGSGQITNYWRPLLLMSFSFDYHTWGLHSIGFHLTNTILHIICAWLVYLLLLGLFRQIRKERKIKKNDYLISFLVSLFFLVHPLQTEAITYISGRADPLSSFFALISLIFYVKYREINKRNDLIYSIIFFIFGLLTKEQIVFLPFIVLLIEVIFFSSKKTKIDIKKIVGRLASFFTISVAYFLLRISVLNFNNILGGAKNIGDEQYATSIFLRLFTFCKVIFEYLFLLFVPINLHMEREVVTVKSFLSWPVLLFLLFIVLIFIISKYTWKKNKMISFGVLWFVVILLPRMNIIKINRPMYEHWLYFPMIGFWLALFSLIFFFIDRVKIKKQQDVYYSIFITFTVFLLIIFSFLSVVRNRVWNNPIIFYENNLRYTPNSFIQHNNLGMAYSDIARYDRAILNYRKAIEIKDVYPQVHSNLANALIRIGKTDEAISEYKKAKEVNPSFSIPYYGLLNIYLMAGDKVEVEKILEEMDKNLVNKEEVEAVRNQIKNLIK